MASAVATKGGPLAGILKKLLLAAPPAALALRPASVAAARRLFSTGGAPFRRRDDDDYFEDEESSGDEDVFYAVRRRRARGLSAPTFFSADVVDPFGEPVRMGRLLALMEEEEDDDDDDDAAAPRRGWWVSKEDDDAVQLKVPMPGVGKEHVKVWAGKDGSLMIKGEGAEDNDEEEGPARYRSHIELPRGAFKVDQIKAEMKDGVLKVTVPKIKLKDRKDVFQVKVE